MTPGLRIPSSTESNFFFIFNDLLSLMNLYLLNHLALQMSSLEGIMPGPMALSILALIIFFFVGFSRMFFVILSLQEEHTCVQLRRLAIIIISLKARSGKLSQLGWSPISAMLAEHSLLQSPVVFDPVDRPTLLIKMISCKTYKTRLALFQE